MAMASMDFSRTQALINLWRDMSKISTENPPVAVKHTRPGPPEQDLLQTQQPVQVEKMNTDAEQATPEASTDKHTKSAVDHTQLWTRDAVGNLQVHVACSLGNIQDVKTLWSAMLSDLPQSPHAFTEYDRALMALERLETRVSSKENEDEEEEEEEEEKKVNEDTRLHSAPSSENEESETKEEASRVFYDFPNNEGITPILTAAIHKHWDIVLFLAENGASLTRKAFMGNTILHLLMGSANCMDYLPKLVEIARRTGQSVLPALTNSKKSILLSAVEENRYDAVKYLLEQSVAPELIILQDERNYTPAACAAVKGNEDMFDLLIDAHKAFIIKAVLESDFRTVSSLSRDFMHLDGPPIILAAKNKNVAIVLKMVAIGCTFTDEIFNDCITAVEEKRNEHFTGQVIDLYAQLVMKMVVECKKDNTHRRRVIVGLTNLFKVATKFEEARKNKVVRKLARHHQLLSIIEQYEANHGQSTLILDFMSALSQVNPTIISTFFESSIILPALIRRNYAQALEVLLSLLASPKQKSKVVKIVLTKEALSALMEPFDRLLKEANSPKVAEIVQLLETLMNAVKEDKDAYLSAKSVMNNVNFLAICEKAPPSLECEPLKDFLRTHFPEFICCGICDDVMVSPLPCKAESGGEHFKKVIPCNHKFCSTCLRTWISQNISERVLHIRCPEASCSFVLYPDDVKRIADKETVDKYERYLNEDFSGRLKQLTDDGLLDWAKQNCKTCPSCHVLIERSAGCNSMLCTCGTRFTWTERPDDPLA